MQRHVYVPFIPVWKRNVVVACGASGTFTPRSAMVKVCETSVSGSSDFT